MTSSTTILVNKNCCRPQIAASLELLPHLRGSKFNCCPAANRGNTVSKYVCTNSYTYLLPDLPDLPWPKLRSPETSDIIWQSKRPFVWKVQWLHQSLELHLVWQSRVSLAAAHVCWPPSSHFSTFSRTSQAREQVVARRRRRQKMRFMASLTFVTK